MHHLSRFGVSLEEDLLAAFDLSIGSEGYQNRSEAIRFDSRPPDSEKVGKATPK
jgi:metal-responsive CopG/Arc/MetJ family transcriptional regulator